MRTLTVSTEEEAREALASDALDFLLAGGVLSRAEWAELDEPHRRAFVRAGEAREAQRMDALAAAVLGGISDALTDAKMDQAMQRAGKA